MCKLKTTLKKLVYLKKKKSKVKWASQVVLVVKNPSASAGDMRDLGLVPELGRSPGEGHGDPLQYSRLEKPHEQEEPTGLRSIGLQSWTQLNQLKACMLNIHLSYDPAILLLGIHPREIKACVHAKTCI